VELLGEGVLKTKERAEGESRQAAGQDVDTKPDT
jgi:hypothetical protein